MGAIFQQLTIEREFQIFLLGYIIVEICEIFTVGGFPLDSKVRRVWKQQSQQSRNHAEIT